MKKTLLLCVACLSMLACKKENKQSETTIAKERYPVEFGISQFSQITTPISTKTTTATNDIEAGDGTPTPVPGVGQLLFAVYDSNGNLVSRLKQDFGSPTKTYRISNGLKKQISSGGATTFGAIKDTLAAGTYTVVVAGSGAPMELMLNSGNEGVSGVTFTNVPLSSASLNYQLLSPFADTFYYKGTITVGAGTSAHSIALTRIVGMVQLNMEDVAPASAVYYTTSIAPAENNAFKLSNNTPTGTLGTPWNAPIERDVNSLTNRTGSLTYWYRLSKQPATITLKFLDANRNVLVTKTIPNIVVKANEITKVSGKVFESAASFTITNNINWVTGTTIKF